MTEQQKQHDARILQIYRQFSELDEEGKVFVLQSLDGSGKPHVQALHDVLKQNR